MPGLRASAPSSMRRPIGDHGVGCAPRCDSRGRTFSRLAFSVLTRRSSGARLAIAVASATRSSPNTFCQMRVQPFRIIAGNVRRCIVEGARGQRRALGLAQRLRRKSFAVAQIGDRLGRHAALEPEHAEHARARRVGVHQPGARRPPPQHVPDQACNRGAVARAGIAMRGAPLLQRLCRGNALRVDGLDQFDGGGQPGSGSHSKLSRSEAAASARSRSTSPAPPARRQTTPGCAAGCCSR